MTDFFPRDPPTFMRALPHYYINTANLIDDIEAGGLHLVDVERLVLESPPAPPAEIAAGYCLGTPLRAEIEARGGDFDTVFDAIGTEIEARLGTAAVTARMQAYV